MDRVRLYSDELEEIMDAEAPLNIRSEVPRIPGMLPTVITEKETVTIKVKPIVKQRPEEIGAMMKTEESFSDGRGVGQNQMAEETSVGTWMVIKDDLIVKPVPSPVVVDVSTKTRTNEGTTEVCAFDILCRNETTKREVFTELLDISRQWIPQGFLRLAEEAKFVGVGNTPSGMMTEILPEIAEVTGPTSDSISWKIEEDSEESAVSLGEVMHEVTSIRFDVGHLMRWPDGNSDDTLICEFQLESELFSHSPARREAEPVFVAAESEMFTPVFAGGVVTESEPPVVAEAVTSRVSVLPTVGSKFQTGLSAAVGGEDRWCLSLGGVLDQVGHVAGRLDARMVPVEQFLLFSKVHPVMLAWLRPMFALTSQFFLSDIEEDVEVPPSILNGQPVRRTEVCFGDENIGPQMTEGTHGVGPTGDRWDGKCILDVWYRLYKWMDTQLWDPGTILGMNNEPETVKLGTVERLIHEPADKLLIEGNPNSGRPVDTTGWVGRNRQYEVNVSWLDGHPNRRGGSVIAVVGATMMQYGGYIKGIPTEDWGLSNRPASDEHVPTGFHEILICDMGQEEWPRVPISEIGCLRLDWPKELFSFVGRYQLELEQMRKECRDQYSNVTSGTCPTCEKFIQVNWGNTSHCITWIWHSYGDALLAGARFGRGLLRTVWITCAELTILVFR